MLRRIASTDPNEVTFYGHAKGVRHEPSVSNAVRQWADVSYRASLDDWRAVRAQMERYALTGSFRMYGRFRSHRHAGDWHYSGTYYWMRHARVFAKDCFAVPPFYCGVEAWPGKYFARHEAGCLLFDDVRQLAYDERFWESRREEIEHWESTRARVEPPTDLEPRPMEGCEGPPLRQRPDEFAWLLDKLPAASPRKILAIGAAQGAVAWHIARIFRSVGQDIELTVAVPDSESSNVEEIRVLEDARQHFGQTIKIAGDRAQLDPQYDAVWIDGDRSYSGARGDFELALSRSPRLIGLYNIADSDWQAQNRCCVSRLWAEVSGHYPSESLISGTWGGVGILRLAD
jgi:predicted O-methyltransferase YrrM